MRHGGAGVSIRYLVGMRLVALSLALGLGAAGCYASHERGTSGAAGCRWPDPSCAATEPGVPDGVCALDGEIVAFADGDRDVVCRGMDGDATRFGEVVSCGPSGPRRRSVACCPPSDDPLLLGWVFSGPGGTLAVRTDEPAAECLAMPDDPYPVGPFAPWEPAELCDDPLGWSGVPLFFSVRTAGADPCDGGVSHAELCRTRLDGDRIVVELTIAPAEVRGCDLALSDDEARCAVPPLPAGDYEIVDARGRTLGVIAVPDRPPAAREPRCAPISR